MEIRMMIVSSFEPFWHATQNGAFPVASVYAIHFVHVIIETKNKTNKQIIILHKLNFGWSFVFVKLSLFISVVNCFFLLVLISVLREKRIVV